MIATEMTSLHQKSFYVFYRERTTQTSESCVIEELRIVYNNSVNYVDADGSSIEVHCIRFHG